MSAYDEFVRSKAFVTVPTGIAKPPPLNRKLKPHQKLLTNWALRRGRAAIFADTGLGKGWMILEWARVVSYHTEKPVLVLAPLAVAEQFERESYKLWGEHLSGGPIGFTIARDDSDIEETSGVCVTNYQKLHKFDLSRFGGVALDESSILKSFDGATRNLLIESFANTPFRLSATATPSPNDHTELGGQAEFLGVMTHQEMLASFFIRDGGSTQDWRLKGHAREVFWRWVCSWGAIVKMPSDLGCSDDGYVLPALRYHEHVIPASQEDARAAGLLFAEPAKTLAEQRTAKRGSLGSRVERAAQLARAAPGKCVIWCELNSEQDALRRELGDLCVSVQGSTKDEDRIALEAAWREGEVPILITKPVLFGHGLNWQHCSNMVFVGVSNSFEQFYQAVRRCWRFGQESEVDAHIVSSELEGAVVENLKRKMADAATLAEETRKHVAAHVRAQVGKLERETVEYRPTRKFSWPAWLKTERAA